VVKDSLPLVAKNRTDQIDFVSCTNKIEISCVLGIRRAQNLPIYRHTVTSMN